MKWIYYIVVFFVLVSIFGGVFFLNSAIAKEREEEEFYHLHEIKSNLKTIANKELKKIFEEKVNSLKESFLKQIKGVTIQKDIPYTFYLTSDVYYYKDYISIVLFIEEYQGGAHPNKKIWTIVWDGKEKKKIDVASLNLKEISKSVRGDLLNHPKIVDTAWMMEGTKATNENYQNFVFTEQGILFFFPPYQVAPYSSGTFEVFVN